MFKMKRTKKEVSLLLSQFTITVVLFVFILLPFIKMLIGIRWEDIVRVVNSPMFVTAIKNSLMTCLTTTVISVSLALALAFAIQRTGVKWKAFMTVFVTLPMLIPSISVGTSMIVLFGTNGVITNMLHLNRTVYGFWGIVIGAVLYSYPVASRNLFMTSIVFIFRLEVQTHG